MDALDSGLTVDALDEGRRCEPENGWIDALEEGRIGALVDGLIDTLDPGRTDALDRGRSGTLGEGSKVEALEVEGRVEPLERGLCGKSMSFELDKGIVYM